MVLALHWKDLLCTVSAQKADKLEGPTRTARGSFCRNPSAAHPGGFGPRTAAWDASQGTRAPGKSFRIDSQWPAGKNSNICIQYNPELWRVPTNSSRERGWRNYLITNALIQRQIVAFCIRRGKSSQSDLAAFSYRQCISQLYRYRIRKCLDISWRCWPVRVDLSWGEREAVRDSPQQMTDKTRANPREILFCSRDTNRVRHSGVRLYTVTAYKMLVAQHLQKLARGPCTRISDSSRSRAGWFHHSSNRAKRKKKTGDYDAIGAQSARPQLLYVFIKFGVH